MPFTFENGRQCIDFASTQFGPWSGSVERLNNYYDLAGWIRQSGVVDGARPIGEVELRRAKVLRSLVIELVSPSDHPGQPSWGQAKHQLNLIARRPRAVLQFRGDDRVIRRGGFEEFLVELAVDTIDLLARPEELARVRNCGAADCRRLFFDRSAAARRRWCSKGCRDRRSSANYRAAA